jgi:glucose-6-phosphate isomerase
MTSLSENASFRQLKNLYESGKKDLRLNDLFNGDPNRFEKYSEKLSTNDGEILFDYSKNLIDEQVLKELFSLVSFFTCSIIVLF